MYDYLFHKYTGFKTYQEPSDSKNLIITWSGLVTETLRLHASMDDVNRINHIARMYFYLSGMLRIINGRFEVDQVAPHSPSFWYDLKLIEQAVSELSEMYHCWFTGSNFHEACVLYNTDIILMSLRNMCLMFGIKPTVVLNIARESIKEDLRQIPEPNIRYPLMHLRKRGVKKKKGNDYINTKDKYWKYVLESRHALPPEYNNRNKSKDLTIEDRRWMECFHGIIEDMEKG